MFWVDFYKKILKFPKKVLMIDKHSKTKQLTLKKHKSSVYYLVCQAQLNFQEHKDKSQPMGKLYKESYVEFKRYPIY